MDEGENGMIGISVEGLTNQDLACLDEWEGDVSPFQAVFATKIRYAYSVFHCNSAYPLIHYF